MVPIYTIKVRKCQFLHVFFQLYSTKMLQIQSPKVYPILRSLKSLTKNVVRTNSIKLGEFHYSPTLNFKGKLFTKNVANRTYPKKIGKRGLRANLKYISIRLLVLGHNLDQDESMIFFSHQTL